MATTITTSADDSFEGRLKARLKESIGDLVTDQDLSNLVNRSLEEIFFTERKNPKRGYYNNEPEKIPPLLHEIVKECLQPAVNAAVSAWVKEHTDTVNKTVEQVVTQGVGNAVLQAMNSQFQSQIFTFQQNVLQNLQSKPL